MAYNKTTWVNNSTPALDATHLNNIEDGITNVDTRLSTAEGVITALDTRILSNDSEINGLTTQVLSLEVELTDAMIVRTGTFSGVWSPTLQTTFNISNYNNYYWAVSVHQTSPTMHNGDDLELEGYLDVDNNTLRFVSESNNVAETARYTLIGVKKTMSNYAQLNQ